jgi:hypothetical protein
LERFVLGLAEILPHHCVGKLYWLEDRERPSIGIPSNDILKPVFLGIFQEFVQLHGEAIFGA